MILVCVSPNIILANISSYTVFRDGGSSAPREPPWLQAWRGPLMFAQCYRVLRAGWKSKRFHRFAQVISMCENLVYFDVCIFVLILYCVLLLSTVLHVSSGTRAV